MSSNEEQGGAGRREVAYRLFASEFDDADFSYSESDEERAPNYVVTPTGARVNRLFLVGVLTEVETVSEDYLRARIVDPSGPFVVYAGQYQPEALAFLESAQPPTFVAVTGKARTYQPDDSDQVYTSVRPESISEVDADTRDRWVVATAEQTLERVARAAEAKHSGLTGDDLRAALVEHGVGDGLAAGLPIALEHYGTTGEYLSTVRSLALDAARVVADEQDEVESLSVLPGQGTDDAVPTLIETPIDADGTAAPETSDDAATSATADDASDQRAGTADPSTDRSTASPSEATAAGDAEPTTRSAGDTEQAEQTETPAATTSDVSVDTDEETTGSDETATDASEPSTAEPADSTAETTTEPVSETGETTEREAATDAEPVAESEPTAETGTVDEPEPTAETGTTEESDELGDFDPEFELDEDEREEIESEYGTEFQSGAEVDDPGEADIETPDPDELDADTGSSPSETGDDAATETATETSDDATTADAATDPVEDIDLEDAVMDVMGELDDGDGADHETVVGAVVDRTGSDPDAVEDAIQDALMGGRCYEPDDGVLKPI